MGVKVRRHPKYLVSDHRRVILRHLNLNDPRRITSIIKRITSLGKQRISTLVTETTVDFASRHRNVEEAFLDSYSQVSDFVALDNNMPSETKLLIGAYFTSEYSFESAALFNPSIVPHPDQHDLPLGTTRFLMSLRATGEGHISSVVFRRGILASSGDMIFDRSPRYALSAKPVPDKYFDKSFYYRQVVELGVNKSLAERVLDNVPKKFTFDELAAAIRIVMNTQGRNAYIQRSCEEMLWLAQANYELRYPPDCLPSEIVIFPATENERRGMEDLRLVRFTEGDGSVRYIGTYTAFDGTNVLPMLLETKDFQTFYVSTLVGKYAKTYGMAMFRRKVDREYVMVSRHDGEYLYILTSNDY